MVKRYDIECELVGDRLHTRMVNADEGDYVTYNDYQKLENDHNEIKRMIRDLEEMLNRYGLRNVLYVPKTKETK